MEELDEEEIMSDMRTTLNVSLVDLLLALMGWIWGLALTPFRWINAELDVNISADNTEELETLTPQ